MMKSWKARVTGPLAILTMLALAAVPGIASATYIGASYGWTKGHSSDFEDSTGSGWRAFLGSGGRILGWEVGYAKLTGFKGQTLDNIDINAWDASLLAGISLGPVRLFGSAGGVYSTVDAASRSSNDWTYKYGVGVDTHFGPVGVRLAWDRYPIKSEVIDADVDVASAGLMFRF